VRIGGLTPKGTNFYRDAKAIKKVNLLKSGKAKRNSQGKIIKAAEFQKAAISGTVARIEPNRRWFENTKTVGVKDLSAFRNAIQEQKKDSYKVIIKQNKLPMGLIQDEKSEKRSHLLETEPHHSIISAKSIRKKPKLTVDSIDDLVIKASKQEEDYDMSKDSDMFKLDLDMHDATPDPIFSKGTSRRIWNELYKVIDSSDVVIHVLDARDPEGTRCRNVERYLKKEKSHKHMIFVLNKCDLVPTWVTVCMVPPSIVSLLFHVFPIVSQYPIYSWHIPTLLHLPMQNHIQSQDTHPRNGHDVYSLRKWKNNQSHSCIFFHACSLPESFGLWVLTFLRVILFLNVGIESSFMKHTFFAFPSSIPLPIYMPLDKEKLTKKRQDGSKNSQKNIQHSPSTPP
jgi:hypothetical protein